MVWWRGVCAVYQADVHRTLSDMELKRPDLVDNLVGGKTYSTRTKYHAYVLECSSVFAVLMDYRKASED